MLDAFLILAAVLAFDAETQLRAELGFYPPNEVCKRMEDLAIRHRQWCWWETRRWDAWKANNPLWYQECRARELDAERLASFWQSIETATNPAITMLSVRASALETARGHAERCWGNRHAIPPPVPVWWYDSR